MCKNECNGKSITVTVCECGSGSSGTGGSGAGSSGTGSNNSSGVPVGTVISYMGLTAPEGYLVMDGAQYNITDYPVLAEHFKTQLGMENYYGGDGAATFTVPDARGEFMRGYDPEHVRDSIGEVTDRGIGKHQEATCVKATYSDRNTFGIQVGETSYVSTDMDKAYRDSIKLKCYSGIESTAYNGFVSKYTTRPTNINVLYCIKY